MANEHDQDPTPEFSFGEIGLYRVEEKKSDTWKMHDLFSNADEAALQEAASWMIPDHYIEETGAFRLCIHTWLVKTPKYNIIVDTCIGNCKDRPAFPEFHQLDQPFLERLSETGVTPEDIDYVLLTHLHPDHVGWNTRLENGEWVPTFPNARYVTSTIELESLRPEEGKDQAFFNENVFEDSVQPIIDAGLLDTYTETYELDDIINIRLAPGHTEGHCVIVVRSLGESAMFCGDIFFSPIQVLYPEWADWNAFDIELAKRTRAELLQECADEGHVLIPAHWDSPFMAWIKPAPSGEGFVPHFIDKAEPEQGKMAIAGSAA